MLNQIMLLAFTRDTDYLPERISISDSLTAQQQHVERGVILKEADTFTTSDRFS